jgi:hypothetical protein
MPVTIEDTFTELISNRRKFIETLLVVEDKNRVRVPFRFNPIQARADEEKTGRDIWVKPSQAGFSTYKLADALVDTLCTPGTNTVLVAYEEFITSRLLAKTDFFYNHLESLNIPGFPVADHNSSYEKTFKFYNKGVLVSKSSMYIASANSKVAGRAETIHHLLCDEFAFWDPNSIERIFVPALDRVPADGTVDIFSTPNGEDNAFREMYAAAKEQEGQGTNTFTAHFFPWMMVPEYRIQSTDPRCIRMPMLRDPLSYTLEEQELIRKYPAIDKDQIRWRRWKIAEKRAIRKTGEMELMFQQEFAEDDKSCFLSAGDMYYDPDTVNSLANGCYDAPIHKENLNIWKDREEVKGLQKAVVCDPGQAKVTQTAITVWAWSPEGKPIHCATDAGWYPPEVTCKKMLSYSQCYDNALMIWEANSHGLAISEGLKAQRPIYFREDIISGKSTVVPGWLTTPGNKPYMLSTMSRNLYDMDVHDISFVSQLRNIRVEGDKTVVVGLDDIHMSGCIAMVTHNSNPVRRGLLMSMRGNRYS